MFGDPLTRWEEGFPYQVLAACGVHPDSSMAEILDAGLSPASGGALSAAQRLCWEQVRFRERRLFVDFFLYRLIPEPGSGEEEPTR